MNIYMLSIGVLKYNQDYDSDFLFFGLLISRGGHVQN